MANFTTDLQVGDAVEYIDPQSGWHHAGFVRDIDFGSGWSEPHICVEWQDIAATWVAASLLKYMEGLKMKTFCECESGPWCHGPDACPATVDLYEFSVDRQTQTLCQHCAKAAQSYCERVGATFFGLPKIPMENTEMAMLRDERMRREWNDGDDRLNGDAAPLSGETLMEPNTVGELHGHIHHERESCKSDPPCKPLHTSAKPDVWVTVLGGVAELVEEPQGVQVHIIDWDDIKASTPEQIAEHYTEQERQFIAAKSDPRIPVHELLNPPSEAA